MLLSNQKIEYSSVRRVPNVKLTGQTSNTTTTTSTTTVTTNTMPTSTSLQDISSHAQKFTWSNNDNSNDQRLGPCPETLLRKNPVRHLKASQSDERIFEHPEVTIKPSALDDELQRRLLSLRTSNTTENLLEQDARQSAPNILEHPDMRAPVVMQSQQASSPNSSLAFLIQNDCKRITRTQSAADACATMARTPSPGNRVEFFIENHQTIKRSVSPIGNILESPEQEKDEDLPTTAECIRESSKSSSKSDQTTKNESS